MRIKRVFDKSCGCPKKGGAATLKWPPSLAEVREAARPYLAPCGAWDEKFARDAYECLGLETPLYRQMQLEAQERKRLK